MKKLIILCLIILKCGSVYAQNVFSPDGKIKVTFSLDKSGQPNYQVWYNAEPVILASALGIKTADSTQYQSFKLVGNTPSTPVTSAYQMVNAKKSSIVYSANNRLFKLRSTANRLLDIIFQVSNDGVAFRYQFPDSKQPLPQIVKEATSFHFTDSTTAWLQPKAEAQTGFEHTNPSYEEDYRQNIPVGNYAKNGWIYPALFKSGKTWVLITEAGMDGTYCGTNLYNENRSSIYGIKFPDARETFTEAGTLPKNATYTPWRVIAIGPLKTIVESTLGTDLAIPSKKVVDASYIKPGKASWSWIMSKDDSITYTETKRYIDFASRMKWQYCLVDANWDTKIGYNKVEELAAYAKNLNVGILLWYNSAGAWNTVKMTPKDKMVTAEIREKEFERLSKMGIKGIKIDFFGGDGQSMVKYYTDILESALKYKLLVNFHGATLPRGWARTYPNLMTTEAVKGFEMITFSQGAANAEPTHAAMLPFTRNAFDPMDFTPMNLYKIQARVTRKTTPAFELATSVLFLSGIQHYAESPDGMAHFPEFVLNYLRQLPDYWDDVRFVDGYPGKYAVIARKGNGKWYIAAINGENAAKKITLDLSLFKDAKSFNLIEDDRAGNLKQQVLNVAGSSKVDVELLPNGGFVVTQN